MKDRLCLTYASLLYIGRIPGAPGTYASLTTAVLYFLLHHFTGRILPALHLSAVCLITIAGIYASDAISRKTGIEDPSYIVIDEVAGQLLSFLFLPVGIVNVLMGFIAFRVFDMWKPFPIRKLESLRHGTGVMADDLLAGVYACLLIHGINLIRQSIHSIGAGI